MKALLSVAIAVAALSCTADPLEISERATNDASVADARATNADATDVPVEPFVPATCEHEGQTYTEADIRTSACTEGGGTSNPERGFADGFECWIDSTWLVLGRIEAEGSCAVSDIAGNSYRICDGESATICGGSSNCTFTCNNGALEQ